MNRNTTAAGRIHRNLIERARARDNEAGVAMLSAILFMIIMAGLATVIASVVLAQVTPSYIAQKSTKTVYAAQAGMQAALGRLRSASRTDPISGKTFGDPAILPCTVTGNVDPLSSDGIQYSVAISYFSTDPTGKSLQSLPTDPSLLPCNPGHGVTVAAGTAPKYAVLVSKGAGPALPGTTDTSFGNRALAAIYAFKVTNLNVAGGRIYDYNNANKYCMSAVPPVGFTTAQIGSEIQFLTGAACATSPANDALQLWVYDTDYEIKLASTMVGSPLVPLCITGPVAGGDSSPENAKLAQCISAPSLTRWNQLWSWQGSNSWQGMNSTNTGTSSWWMETGKASGSALLPTDRLKVSTTLLGGFAPSSLVGPAAAGPLKNEIVNYQEFGRCTDITGSRIPSPYSIVYPCKQDPTGTGLIDWNQQWYYSEPDPGAGSKAGQQIYVYDSATVKNSSTKLCATRPTSLTAPAFITFETCGGAYAARQSWTRVYDSGTYATSYWFTDPTGTQCLAVDPGHPATSDGGWSTIVVTACTGSDAQKWNAPPTYSKSGASGYKEIAG